MPAIVDHDASAAPLPVSESGAILPLMAQLSGRFEPHERTAARSRQETRRSAPPTDHERRFLFIQNS